MFELKTEHIVIVILIIVILFFIWNDNNNNKEHFLTGNEAVLNIAKVYADSTGTATFNNIKINGNIDVSGTTNFSSTGFSNDVRFNKNIDVSGNINSGNIGTRGLSVTGGSDEGIGGAINLGNSKKTQTGTAKTWTIYNMSNRGPNRSYSDGLEFWKYDADTGSGNKVFTMKDSKSTTDTGQFEALGHPFASCAWNGDRRINGGSGGTEDDIIITCKNNNISHMYMASGNE